MNEWAEEYRWRDGKTKVVHRLTPHIPRDAKYWGWYPACGASRSSVKRSQCAAPVDCIECIAREP